jgi:mannose-6-phosphate isomerase
MIAKLLGNRVRRTYLGGGRIDAFCGVSADVSDGVPRPEDWLASTTQAFNGTVEICGEGLGRLEDGRLVKDVAGPLPILVKLLDSDERLVIQAHPTVPCAKRLFNSTVGKTECWYFLPGTAPDACVYLGFKPGVTREAWREAFEAQEGLLSFLHRIPVAPGDFVFVDGGVPHAIGAGCFMIELQEPSDLMVVAERFTPSGRRIPDAKMHGGIGWDRMFDVYEYEGVDYGEVCRRYVRRGSGNKERKDRGAFCICGPELTDKFGMWRVFGGARVALPRESSAVVVTDGEGALNGVGVKKGDRLIVCGERNMDVQGDVALVVCA